MKIKQIYVANDGNVFNTEEECKEYEKELNFEHTLNLKVKFGDTFFKNSLNPIISEEIISKTKDLIADRYYADAENLNSIFTIWRSNGIKDFYIRKISITPEIYDACIHVYSKHAIFVKVEIYVIEKIECEDKATFTFKIYEEL